MFFSVIIPLYNRPDEIKELLESLTEQTYKNFEVIIVEDGSTEKSDHIIASFTSVLNIRYFFKPNTGPGDSRNYGVHQTSSDYFIFLDSDCIIPDKYMEAVNAEVEAYDIECFGGPDEAHPSFTNIQKAISYSMTSFLTTGGMRGGSEKVIKFHPRSFNMGFSRRVFEKTRGFGGMRFGEDIDLSLRIEKAGFSCALIKEAFVYHKRRTDFKKFFKQIYNSGIARINLFKLHPSSLKLTHFAPAVFAIFLILSLAALSIGFPWFFYLLLLYLMAIMLHATFQFKSVQIGILAIIATLVQMISYGTGFIIAFILRVLLRKDAFSAFTRNFYK